MTNPTERKKRGKKEKRLVREDIYLVNGVCSSNEPRCSRVVKGVRRVVV